MGNNGNRTDNAKQLDKLGKLPRLERAKQTYVAIINQIGIGSVISHMGVREISKKIVHPKSLKKEIDVSSSVLYAVVRILINSGALEETATDLKYTIREINIDNITNDTEKRDMPRPLDPFFSKNILTPHEWEDVVTRCKSGKIVKVKDVPVTDDKLFDVILKDPYNKKLFRCTGIPAERGYGHVEVNEIKE